MLPLCEHSPLREIRRVLLTSSFFNIRKKTQTNVSRNEKNRIAYCTQIVCNYENVIKHTHIAYNLIIYMPSVSDKLRPT